MTASSDHYDASYFADQQLVGQFAGWADLTKFHPYVEPHFRVIDFGCGGGFLLQQLVCQEKLGIEPNPAARAGAQALGIATVATVADVADEWADLIVSNHALEHAPHPLLELKALAPKVKPGRRLVFVVPSESVAVKYAPDDVTHHLYTWSPHALGNLFVEAGYEVETCEAYLHRWPPGYRAITRMGGRPLFEAASRAYGRMMKSYSQVRIVARRP